MQNTIKKIIIILTTVIILGGIFFGVIFYQNTKKIQQPNSGDITNTNPERTPFQTRVSTSTDFNTNTENNNILNPEISTSTGVTKPRLLQLWKEPVSGFGFVSKDIDIISTSTDNSTTSIIKSIQNKKVLKNQEFIYLWDRKTGHIYENLASTTDIAKFSNYTLPEAEEVFFVDNSSLILRILKNDNETIETFYTKLSRDLSTTTNIFTSDIKNTNIDSQNIAFSADFKKIFYFLKGTGRGILSSPDGVVKTNIINTPLSEFLPQYVNKDIVALTTKPSAYFKGYLFTLRTDGGGRNTYIIGEKYGFNTLVSPDGNKVIYNEILNNSLETFIYDIKSKSLTYLSQATIVDKCVWSQDSEEIFCGIPQKLSEAPYPDAWYKNDISFSDNIWSINADTGLFELIIPLQDQIATPVDVYKIQTSKNKKYLLFQDKNTLTLWKYQLILD